MSIKKIALGSAAAVLAISGSLSSVAHASIIDTPFFKVLGTVVVWSGDANGDAVVNDFIINTNPSATGDDADLIAGNGTAVVTGTLKPLVSNTNGAFDTDDDGVFDGTTALEVSDSIDNQIGAYRSSFYVASNTTFNIKAFADNFDASGDFANDATGTAFPDLRAEYADRISLALDVTQTGSDGDTPVAFGTNAQLPYAAASAAATVFNGFDAASSASLADLGTDAASAVDVFRGERRTASAAGSIASQSVRFDAVYNLSDGSGNALDMSSGFGEVSADVTYTVYVP